MKDEEILEKAFKKAKLNGWGVPYTNDYEKFLHRSVRELGFIEGKKYLQWIFSHEFAKAFWGEEEVSMEGEGETLTQFLKRYQPTYNEKIKIRDWHDGELTIVPRWRYHLQQMVLEEHPIKYLEKFLTHPL